MLHVTAATVEGKAVIDRVMTSVKGGTLLTAAAMRAKLDKDGLMDLETYQNWVASIADVPALIHSEVRMTDGKGYRSINTV